MTASPWDEVLKRINPTGAKLEAGVVEAVAGGTVDVNIAGSTVPNVRVAGGLLPEVGQYVWLIRQGTTAVALPRSGVDNYAMTATGPLNVQRTSGYASIEMAGPSGAYIDFKDSTSEDQDARILYASGGSLRLSGSGGVESQSGFTVTGGSLELGSANNLVHNNPGTGSITVGWASDYYRFRLGGNATPAGVKITDYDTDSITLQRTGRITTRESIFANSGYVYTQAFISTTGKFIGGDSSADDDYLIIQEGGNYAAIVLDGTERFRVTTSNTAEFPGSITAGGTIYAGAGSYNIGWDGTLTFRSNYSSNQAILRLNNADEYIWGTSLFGPVSGQSGLNDLGGSSFKWQDVWATNNVIQTSDPSAKVDLSRLPIDPVAFVKALPAAAWRWKQGGRLHFGFDATDVKAAMDEQQIDWGVYIDPTVNPSPDEVEAKSKGVADTKLALRVGELDPVLWEAVRDLIARVEALEAAAT